MFKFIRLKSASDQIAEQVRRLIGEGRLKPGERLPAEREMADMLGVGRQAVRTALSKLQRAGLVEVMRSKGVFVRSLTTDSVAGPLQALLETEIENMFAFMDVRKVLESWCAEEAARRCDSTTLKRLEQSLKDMEEAIREGRAIAKADIDFHCALAGGPDNFVLLHLMDTFTSLLHSTERFRNLVASAENVGTFLRQHRAIYEAIKSGDPEGARKQLQSHLETVSAKIRELLKVDDPSEKPAPGASQIPSVDGGRRKRRNSRAKRFVRTKRNTGKTTRR